MRLFATYPVAFWWCTTTKLFIFFQPIGWKDTFDRTSCELRRLSPQRTGWRVCYIFICIIICCFSWLYIVLLTTRAWHNMFASAIRHQPTCIHLFDINGCRDWQEHIWKRTLTDRSLETFPFTQDPKRHISRCIQCRHPWSILFLTYFVSRPMWIATGPSVNGHK